MDHRVSQRQPLACRECTRRKRKCDKTVPCSRCERLGLNCSREIVQLRRQLSQHGLEIEFLTSIKEDLKGARPNEITQIVQKLMDHIDSLKLGQPHPSGPEATGKEKPFETDDDRPSNEAEQEIRLDEHDVSVVTAIEHLAWGRSNVNCFPHRHCTCPNRRKWTHSTPMNSQSFELAGSKMAASIRLPSSRDAEKLISFHLTRIVWHHNCIHSPTFWKQCQVFWQTGKCDEPQWIALYCSILSTTVFCVQNSARYLDQFDFGRDLQTAQQLFITMVDVLYSCNFMQNLSFYAVQAIVISTEVAHNLGLSQLNATLLGAALRIAECLGVHKIQDTISYALTPEDAWSETIDMETGRRVWCQMVIQDYFAIPFTDSYNINPTQYFTSPPHNAHDHDLVARADSVPTISTYTRVLATIAKLMPEFIDGLGPLNGRKSVEEQYKHALRMDQKMREVVSTIPGFLLRQDAEKESLVGWLEIARHSLAITASEKIIMIHRPFILRSFSSDAYARTRQTCVAAAMTILREHENIALSGELCLWTHTAFCITATVILCFEIIMGRSSISEDRYQMLKDLIRAARHRLERRNHDILARRGIFLISAIIPDLDGAMEAATSNLGTIDLEEITRRFSSDWAFLGPELVDPFVDQEQSNITGSHSLLPAENDFESWFSDVFTTANMQI